MSGRRKQIFRETLAQRMNYINLSEFGDGKKKENEREKFNPEDSLQTRLKIVEEILEKLPSTLSGKLNDVRREFQLSTAAIPSPGPNVRNELIQMYQTTETLSKNMEHLDSKLNGVIQASLDGQRLDANVKEEPVPVPVPAPQPIIQYVQEPIGRLTLTSLLYLICNIFYLYFQPRFHQLVPA